VRNWFLKICFIRQRKSTLYRYNSELAALWISERHFIEHVPLETQEMIRQGCAFRTLMIESTSAEDGNKGPGRNHQRSKSRASGACSASPRNNHNNSNNINNTASSNNSNASQTDEQHHAHLQHLNNANNGRATDGVVLSTTNNARRGFLERFMVGLSTR
jgi:hypothetical protein